MNRELLLGASNIKNARIQIAECHAQYAALEESSDSWDVYDSTSTDYDLTFMAISRRRDLVDILASAEEPIVIDFLASTSAVREMVGSDRLQNRSVKPLGIAVGLTDRRTPEEKEVDNSLNIHYVAGSIFSLDTWEKIEEKLGGKKASLIVERGLGALTDMPRSPIIFRDIIGKLWDMLSNDEGEMFLQFPDVAELTDYKHDLMNWQVRLLENGVDCTFAYGLMPMARIKKEQDSPENLPFLKLSELSMPYGIR